MMKKIATSAQALRKTIFAACLILGGLWTGGALAQSNPSAYTTGYRYDAGARLVGTIQADPDGSGPLRHAAVRNTYNALGMLTTVETGELAAWQPETVLPAAWPGFTVFKTLEMTFDIWGKTLTERVSSGGTSLGLTQFTYDAAGRLHCSALRMNPAAYGALPASACSLGTEGNNGPDRITVQSYDTLSRPTLTQKAYGTPEQINYVTTKYYPGGPKQSDTDANGNISYYAYDGLVRLQRAYFPSKETVGQYSSTDYEEYGYDSSGNRTSLRKRDGNTITYSFDNLNRVTQKHYQVSTNQDVFYGYDLRNLQLYANYGSHSGNGISIGYDGFGNVSHSTINLDGVVRKLSYLYDAEGHRTRLTFPDNQYFTYTYDGLGRLSQILESGSAVIVEKTYDSQGHRKTLSRGGPASAPVTQTAYQYDPIRLQTLSHNLDGTATNYDQSWTFGFNPANQLTSRDLTNSAYAFVQTGPTNATYAVNGLNQYTTIYSPTGTTQAHDANGNMTSDGSTIYAYDLENRLVSASGGRTMSYDPNGRLYQTAGGVSGTTKFLYDGDALVGEYNASGTMLRRYVHGSGVDEPLVQYTGAALGAANRNYLHSDHQGSIVAITNGSGATQEVDTYSEYGVPATGNRSRFQYTGQISLPDLGMYYYKARIYNPGLGRFMQTDPIGYKDDINLYAYVGGNPLNARDPSGTIVETVWDAGNVAMGAVSFAKNIAIGNYVGAAVDAVGMAADIAATATPFVPGGAAAAIKASRTVGDAVQAGSSTNRGSHLADDTMVCRGGECKAGNFAEASGKNVAADGTIGGVSTQSRNGAGLAELAQPFPNGQVGVTTAGKIRAAGGKIVADGRADNPNHATVSGLTAAQYEKLFTPTVTNPVPKADRGLPKRH